MTRFKDATLRALGSDKVLNIVGIATGVLVGVLVAAMVLFGPGLWSNSADLKRSADILGCRSVYAGQVTNARTNLDIARSELEDGNADLNRAKDDVVEAATLDGEENLAPLLAILRTAEGSVDDLQLRNAKARDRLADTSVKYQSKIIESIEDPSGFIVKCKEITP